MSEMFGLGSLRSTGLYGSLYWISSFFASTLVIVLTLFGIIRASAATKLGWIGRVDIRRHSWMSESDGAIHGQEQGPLNSTSSTTRRPTSGSVLFGQSMWKERFQ